MTSKSNKVVCIAGGSGSGKSTLASGLEETFPGRVSVLGLDHYQYGSDRVPRTVSGLKNYDHPSSINAALFVRDLAQLKSGRAVEVATLRKASTTENGTEPDGTKLVLPSPLIVAEGYLALHFPEVRALYDASVFLRAPAVTRVARRRWAKKPQYVTEVLLPMHDLFIEPSQDYADLVIDVDKIGAADVLEAVAALLQLKKFL